MKHTTRESWLLAAVEAMKPLFTHSGYIVPAVRVACGWPSKGGTATAKRRIGECWDRKASADTALAQIFISPYLESIADDQGVLATLVHEIVHAVVGNKEKHGRVFGKCARAVGLEGKLTATVAGQSLLAEIVAWSGVLGAYPHSSLDKLQSPTKTHTTRMVKCVCDTCGFTCRTTRKWLDDVGAPHCPEHGELTIDKSTLPNEGIDR